MNVQNKGKDVKCSQEKSILLSVGFYHIHFKWMKGQMDHQINIQNRGKYVMCSQQKSILLSV